MARVRQEVGIDDVQGALADAVDCLHLAATSCTHAAFDVARGSNTTAAAPRPVLSTAPAAPTRADASSARSR